MNKKGFTSIELLCVLAIIAIIAFLAFSQVNNANGMELSTPMLASDEVIKEVARATIDDHHQIITIMVYAAEWAADNEGYEKISRIIDEQVEVRAKLIKLGISDGRIILLLANKGGLSLRFDGFAAPVEDGVYLILE